MYYYATAEDVLLILYTYTRRVMTLQRIRAYLPASDIRDRWIVQNQLCASINQESVDYQIVTAHGGGDLRHVTFCLHGLGGSVEDCPFLEDHICSYTPLVRVACFGLSRPVRNGICATFGDVCALLYNGGQALSTIADTLNVQSYNVVAHSWGGFTACVNALSDTRCAKAMLLVSTPDICDAISQMYALPGLPEPLYPFADIFAGRIRHQALAAKAGKSKHQLAWEAISPYGDIKNSAVEMLIYNREEDRTMRRKNVEHFTKYSRDRGAPNVSAEFIQIPELANVHDMPLKYFAARMKQFFFETAPNEGFGSLSHLARDRNASNAMNGLDSPPT